MSATTFLAFLGGLLVLAFAANRLYRLTRVPDVIVLMFVGVLLGPVSGWIRADEFRNVIDTLGTLALMLILFEGGLELNLRETIRQFPGGVFLAMTGFLFTVALVALVAWKTHHLPVRSALLMGAVLGPISSTIMFPLLQQINPPSSTRTILLIEASLNDVLGVFAVSLLLTLSTAHVTGPGGLIALHLSKLVLCVVLVVIFGGLWSRFLPRLSEQRFWQVFTFSVVLLVYAAAQAASHAGLISVLAFGLTLANVRRADPRLREATEGYWSSPPEHHLQILSFHSELAFLVRSFFFILLGVVVELKGLRGYTLLTLGTLGALVVARWIAVGVSGWAFQEKGPLGRGLARWVFPRGLITAVLAIEVLSAQGPAFNFLPALTFAAILFTNALVVVASFRAAHARRLAQIPVSEREESPAPVHLPAP